MSESKTAKGCACTQRLLDMLRAPQPAKKAFLVKVTCVGCGKVFWSDQKKEYCFDCEAKRKRR